MPRTKPAIQTEKEKNKILAEKMNDLPSPISINDEEIIKSIEESLNSALNPLQLEIVELKKQLINNPLSESSSTNSSSELPTDYQEIKEKNDELLKILKTLNTKII